ncbi:MAG: hypothetical protein MUO72_07350 [Bacteroidales bacterium]|nr:hypothetical protein [Bacteroidales bacterium]
MKNKLVIFNFIIVCAFALASCGIYNKVKFYGRPKDEIKSITLFSTMIGKIQQPVLPLINAAMLNEETNSIADKIMDLQKKNIDSYRDVVAFSLMRNFKCEVKYGNSLQSTAEFNELKDNYNYIKALRTENANYPNITIASNDLNPFIFTEGYVLQYFIEPKNYKPVISILCNKLNTDVLAVSYSYLSYKVSNSLVNAAIMGSVFGILRLDTYIFLFDKKGDLISKGHSWSMITNTTGSQINDYKRQFDNLSLIIEPMMVKLARKFQTK